MHRSRCRHAKTVNAHYDVSSFSKHGQRDNDSDSDRDEDSDDEEEEDEDDKPEEQSDSSHLLHFGYDDGKKLFDIPQSMKVDQYDKNQSDVIVERLTNFDEIQELRPGVPKGVCIGCSFAYADEDTLFSNSSVVYDFDHAKKVTVYGRKCTNPRCKHIVLPDPVEYGIYNHSGYSLFSTSVLNRFTLISTSGSITFKGYHSIVASEYEEYETKTRRASNKKANHIPFCSQSLFQQAWAKFIHRQNWNFQFSCPFGKLLPCILHFYCFDFDFEYLIYFVMYLFLFLFHSLINIY